jgi:DNA-binding response OmpR family regulator
MPSCPLCGGPVPELPEITFDKTRRIVACNGKMTHLGPIAWQLFELLHAKRWQIVQVHREYVRSHAAHLRRALKPLGLGVENRHGGGYALTVLKG